jgi:hypothetical protein
MMSTERWLAGMALAAGLSVLTTGPALAQSCADMVEQFAANHSLSAEPPPTVPPSALEGVPSDTQGGMSGSTGNPTTESGSGAVTPESLADSGGVIAPPDLGGGQVITPPAHSDSNMPTAPTIKPDSGPSGQTATGDAMGQAAQTAQLEALVTAAREAAERGDEAQCMNNLEQAMGVAQRAPGGPGGG